MQPHRIVLSLVLALSSLAIATCAQEITVAAAADLQFAMGDLASQYEKQTGNKVNVTYGSSGNFFSQLQNGAPFDLFFSADIEYPRKLEAAGLAEPGTLYEYAVGRIVIWTPADGKADVAKQVYGENISQAAQFVQSGNAQAGIVAMSLAVSPAMNNGKRWEIPADMHPALEQGAVILKDAKNKDAARAFLEFVKSPSGRAILSKYGFEVSDKARSK